MFFLILSTLCSVCISLAMRLSEKHVRNQYALLSSNYMSCLICGLFFLKASDFCEARLGYTALLGIITGTMFLVSLSMMQLNVRKNGLILSSAFGKLGVIIPTLSAILFWGEKPSIPATIGLFLVLAAILLMNWKDAPPQAASQASPGGGKTKLLLMLLLLSSGLSSLLSNLFDQTANSATRSIYLIVLFGTAFVLSLLLAIRDGNKPGLADILFGVLVGVPNYFSSYFLLRSLQSLDAVVVYPVNCIGSMMFLTLLGALLFHEKLSRNETIGLIVTVGALILINC